MSIFDKLKANGAAPAPAAEPEKKTEETFVFTALPESVEQLKALPEAALTDPFQAAALTVCALCAYAAEPAIGIDMLNFLKGPQPLSPMEQQFLKDRFMDGKYYIPFSYFNGATPENDYTPAQPFTLRVTAGPYAWQNEGYAKLELRSGGADSPRPITLRRKGDGHWFLWEQMLLAGIRQPKSSDPWA